VEPDVSSHWHFHFSSNSLSEQASVASLLVFTTATFSGGAIIRTDFAFKSGNQRNTSLIPTLSFQRARAHICAFREDWHDLRSLPHPQWKAELDEAMEEYMATNVVMMRKAAR
jgi:hypothetical protein